jgi:hypothetical protein
MLASSSSMLLYHSLSGIPMFLYLPSRHEVPEVLVKSQHPLHDRFFLEYDGLADDGMIQLQLAIRAEHPRLIDRKLPAFCTLIGCHRLELLACRFLWLGAAAAYRIRRRHATESMCVQQRKRSIQAYHMINSARILRSLARLYISWRLQEGNARRASPKMPESQQPTSCQQNFSLN